MSKGRRKGLLKGLTQREEQAMDLIYRFEACTANDIQEHLEGDLNNATVRTILRTLEAKNYVEHKTKGNQFIYKPVLNKKEAASQMFSKLVNTFFSGSVTDAVATFIDEDSLNINNEELEELAQLIEKSKNKEAK